MRITFLDDDDNYLAETRKKTLLYGKLFSGLAVLIVFLFALEDIATAHRLHYLVWRIIGLVPALIFFVAAYSFLPRAAHLIVPFHGASLLGVLVMCTGTAYEVLTRPAADPVLRAGVTGILITAIFLIFIFSAGARNLLGFVLVPPLLVLTIVLVVRGEVTSTFVSHVSSAWLIAIACVVLAIAQERMSRNEFVMRQLAEKRRVELEREVNTARELNDRLGETLGELRREIEERKAMEVVLEKRAAIDDLTGVYNRRAGLEILKQSIYLTQRNAQTLTLCFIDIDDLKSVNDNYGHPEGDELIRKVIAALKRHFRKSDYICRFGGDEFLVILTNCTVEAAEVILDRIKHDIADDAAREDRYRIDISYGLSEYTTENDLAIDVLLKQADDNMYINKQRKKLGNR